LALEPFECQVASAEARLPTYEYRCRDCGEHLEVVQSFKDDPLTECPNCGGSLRKVFGSIGITFKGSGFYKTDSRAGDGAGKRSGEAAAAASASGGESSGKDSRSSDSGGSGSGSGTGSTSGSGSGSSAGSGSGSGSGSASAKSA
jgi:putative FmdB family regulatory protein